MGLGGQGAGDGDALLLAAGQATGINVGLLGQPDKIEAHLHPLANARRVGAGDAHRQRHVVGDGLVMQQVEVLKDHPDAMPGLAQDGSRQTGERVAMHDHLAGIGSFEQIDEAQQRGLAGPREADDSVDLALRHAQAGGMNAHRAATGVGKAAGHRTQLDGRC